MNPIDFLKGYKFKLLGLAWAAAAAAEGLLGYDILKSVDPSNWVDNVMYGFGVFAGRSTVDSILERLKGEIIPKV